MKETIVICGGAGSGGSYLAEYITENHPEVDVHVLVRWHSTGSLDNLNNVADEIVLHECDLLDLSSIIKVFRKIKPTKIFNLASHANVKVCFQNPIAVLQNNIMLMANLLEAVRLECPDAVFQQCSTSEVYGNPKKMPMYESHPMAPVNPYAVSKLTQESLGFAYFKSWGIKVIITRMFAYINPRRKDLFATAFARQAVRLEKQLKENTQELYLYHGNLDSIRTLIDVRDAMETYWIASEKCEPGKAYNIGGRETISVGDFLHKLINKVDKRIKPKLNKDLLRPVDVTNQVPNTDNFYNLTKWVPKYSLNESIDFLLDHCRKELND